MPRRNNRNDLADTPPRAALSFFDEDERTHDLSLEGKRKPGEKAVAVVRSTGGIKKKGRKAKPSSAPGPARVPTPTGPHPGSKRYKLAQIAHYKDLMKKHFALTHEILDEHASWPRYATFERIEDYIQKVKEEYIQPIWAREGVKHKDKLEAIHSAKVDTTNYDFESIYKRVSTFAVENGMQNRLTLKKPWAQEGKKPYVNVVLAWLFAAKKQLMYTLTVYLKANKATDPDVARFIHESEAGAAARTEFKNIKATLKQRAPREPPFKDHALMEEQYKALHPHKY